MVEQHEHIPKGERFGPDRAAQIERIFAILPANELTVVDQLQADRIFDQVEDIVDDVISAFIILPLEDIEKYISDQVVPMSQALSESGIRIDPSSPEGVDRKDRLKSRLLRLRGKLSRKISTRRKDLRAQETPSPANVPPRSEEPVPESVISSESEIGEEDGERLLALATTIQAALDTNPNFDPRTDVDPTSGQSVFVTFLEQIQDFDTIYVQALSASTAPSDRTRAKELTTTYLNPVRATEGEMRQRIVVLEIKKVEDKITEAKQDIPAWIYLEGELLKTDVVPNDQIKYYVMYLVTRLKEAQVAVGAVDQEIKNRFDQDILAPTLSLRDQLLDRYYQDIEAKILPPPPVQPEPLAASIAPEINILKRTLMIFGKTADVAVPLAGGAGGAGIGAYQGLAAYRRNLPPGQGMSLRAAYRAATQGYKGTDAEGREKVYGGALPRAGQGLKAGQRVRRAVDNVKDGRFFDANNLYDQLENIRKAQDASKPHHPPGPTVPPKGR